MTLNIQISTPVIPNDSMKATLTECIVSLFPDDTVKVSFHTSGFDSYGQNSFDVLAMDAARHELTDVRNSVMVALFTKMFQN
jgi:hypothetical protein